MSSPKCMEGEIESLINVWFSVIACLCYCYFISSRVPKGKLRFLTLIPIFYLFTILPLSLSSVLPIGITTFFLTWLTNFKLLLFTFDLGPLSPNPPKSLPLFISIACFPIKIKLKETNPSNQNLQNPPKLHLNLPTKVFIFALLLVGLNGHKEKLHPKAILGLYCCLVYLFVDIVMGLCNFMVNAILRIELELPSNEPYLSRSLQDFWGRRWNLMAANILRHTIYKPVRSVFEPFLAPQWASLPGVMATFLVSGLMHELLFYYVTRASPTWEVTWFFVLHGACLVVEFRIKQALCLSQNWRLHWVVSGPITVGFVVVTASLLFFPPLMRNGADERAIKEFKNLVNCVMGKNEL